MSSSVNTKTSVGTVLIVPVPPVPRPTGGDGTPVDPMKPASTRPMNEDERPDACGDRELELHRHGVEDQRAQAGRRQDHDDDAVDDDQAHRLGPGQRAHHGRREERVDAEPRGECEGQPRDEAEQDRHDARGKRCRGGDLREVQAVAVDVLASDRMIGFRTTM